MPHRLAVSFGLLSLSAFAQTSPAPPQKRAPAPPPTEVAGIPVNYDEAKTGNYRLPDALTFADGKPVRNAKEWTEKRRPEIVKLFEENEYGRAPGRAAAMSFETTEADTPAFDGK